MRGKQHDALVVSDGGVASMVAVWGELVRVGHARPERPAVRVREDLAAVIAGRAASGPAVWAVPGISARAMEAVERQAEVAGFELVAERPRMASSGGSPGAEANALLLSACAAAVERGLGRVVWPLHLGAEAGDRAVDAYDRANVVSHLAAIDLPRQGGAGEIRIEAPLVELTDSQLLDLALDLDAPVPRPVRGGALFGAGLGACWWCERNEERQCGVCGTCGRWGVAWGSADPAGVLAGT